jgi:hypothetical protein
VLAWRMRSKRWRRDSNIGRLIRVVTASVLFGGGIAAYCDYIPWGLATLLGSVALAARSVLLELDDRQELDSE